MDAELNRAEAELAQEESSLEAELSRLAAAAADVDRRLRALKKTVAEAALAGVRDGALDARLKVAAAPGVDPAGAFQRSLEARQAALETRREVAAGVRTRAEASRQALSSLSQQLQGDERSAQRLAAMARQKAQLAQEQERAEAAAAPVPASSTEKTYPPGVLEPVAEPAPEAPPPAPPRAPAAKAPPRAAAPSQRGSKRVKMQAEIDFSSDDNFFNGFSSNISDGGLFVATVNVVPLGTEVDLVFSLPSGDRVEAKGVVCWVREVNDKHPDAFPGLGVQFTRLETAAQQAINRFVASREPMFYAAD